MQTIYAHTDGFNSYNGPELGFPDGDFNSPAEWGVLVSTSGHESVYVRDFGSGNQLVTVVTWANLKPLTVK